MSFSDFWAAEKWKVLDVRYARSFDEYESPFEIVNVQIGDLLVYKTTITGAKIEKLPITRWMTKNQYVRFKENTGVVIF